MTQSKIGFGGRRWDRAALFCVGVSLIAHGALFFYLYQLPPAHDDYWYWDAWDRQDRIIKIMFEKQEERPEMTRDFLKDRYGIETAIRGQATAELSTARLATDSTWPFTRSRDHEPDPENALAELMRQWIGLNFGYGGLKITAERRGGFSSSKIRTRLRLGPIEVKGGLSEAVVRRIAGRRANEVRFCYERLLDAPGDGAQPDEPDELVVKARIASSGAVKRTSVASSTLNDEPLEQCIADAVKRWTFPRPEGGKVAIVRYTFSLSAFQ